MTTLVASFVIFEVDCHCCSCSHCSLVVFSCLCICWCDVVVLVLLISLLLMSDDHKTGFMFMLSVYGVNHCQDLFMLFSSWNTLSWKDITLWQNQHPIHVKGLRHSPLPRHICSSIILFQLISSFHVVSNTVQISHEVVRHDSWTHIHTLTQRPAVLQSCNFCNCPLFF